MRLAFGGCEEYLDKLDKHSIEQPGTRSTDRGGAFDDGKEATEETAAETRSGRKLLWGGNPQIPTGEGDGEDPVSDFVAAMPGSNAASAGIWTTSWCVPSPTCTRPRGGIRRPTASNEEARSLPSSATPNSFDCSSSETHHPNRSRRRAANTPDARCLDIHEDDELDDNRLVS